MAGRGRHGRKHGPKKRKASHFSAKSNTNKKRRYFENQGKHGKPEQVLPGKQETKEVEEDSTSESESEEEVTAYQQLVSTVNPGLKELSGSETEESEEEDDESDRDEEGESGNKDVHSGDTENLPDQDDDDDDDNDDDAILKGETSQNINDDEDDGSGDGEENDDEDDDNGESGEDDDDGDEMMEQINESDGDDEEETSKSSKFPDPFSVHFENVLPDELADNLSSAQSWKREDRKVSGIGRCAFRQPKDLPSEFDCTLPAVNDLESSHIKERVLHQLYEVNKKCVPDLGETERMTPLQKHMFQLVNSYQDVYYPMRDLKNGEEIRMVYCLHAVNHVLKTRSRVIAHNTKIQAKKGDPLAEYRDQGLTRPKVLMVVPFRDSALRIVNIISNLLMPRDQSFVSNKKRFHKEYSNANEEPPSGKKPEDFEALFMGNIDDHFRVGLGVSKKSLKLYTDFYASDIIIASPLGLRTIIGADGEEQRDFDFLSSIEMLIFDQADVLLMQNWDHIMHLMSHIHLQPKEAHGADFSRVRMWTLNGWSKFYRQTLVYSSIACPEITALFNKHCQNFSGKLTVLRPVTSGSIGQVVTQLPQVFQRIDCSSISELPETRLDYFFQKIVPHHKESVMAQTLVFIPSYFDYVRVRNAFKKKEIHCEFLCEYTNDKGISRARHFFYHENTAFMLYTERLHFYRRFRIRGVKHIVFYELPKYPHFYSELCNTLQDRKNGGKTDNMTCTVLYTKYESQKLAEVVGTDRATHMLNSEKTVHMFVTGES